MIRYENTLRLTSLRGHTQSGTEENYDVDLRTTYLRSGDRIYVIPGSSLKGILRRNMGILGCDSSFLGSDFGEESVMGKAVIGWGYIKEERERAVRRGIRLDPRLGIVETGALYSYEILPGPLDLKFEVTALAGLTREELACLGRATLLLRYTSVGWGGSRGVGMVEEVILDDRISAVLRQE